MVAWCWVVRGWVVNCLEEEHDRQQRWYDIMLLAPEEVVEGGWMPRSIGRLVELVDWQELQHSNQQESM